MAAVDVSKYDHSPVHKAVILKDYDGLQRIIAGLPQLCDPTKIRTESDSLAEEAKADAICAVIDRRDVPNRETPVHLAVKFGDATAAEILMHAGADARLRNDQGWDALEEAVYHGQEQIARIVVRHHRAPTWAKWCRKRPRLLGTMRRMRDFYMEITFHFESSVIPFISRVMPSDTYKVWKRGVNLRADMTLAGFDNLKIKRSDQSVLFFGDGLEDKKITPGALCLVSHKHKDIGVAVAADSSSDPVTDTEVQKKLDRIPTKIYKPALDMTQAVLLPQTTWKGKDKTETVGHWKTKVYDMHNVIVSIKSRQIPKATPESELLNSCNERRAEGELDDILTEEERKQLQAALQTDSSDLKNESGDGVIAQCHSEDVSEAKPDKKGWLGGRRKGEKKHEVDRNNASQKIPLGKENLSKTHRSHSRVSRQSESGKHNKDGSSDQTETKKSLRPVLWLSPDFPLKIDELLPLLDILAQKVKAIQRIREILTTKLPKGTFPVKLAIPIIPAVRVVVTFTKFEELEPLDEFQTPPSSPTSDFDEEITEVTVTQPSSSSSSWFQWRKSMHHRSSSSASDPYSSFDVTQDPFDFPADYKWIWFEDQRKRRKESKKSDMAKGKTH